VSPHEHWSIAPYFIVDDVVASADFYRDRLGFRYDRFWGDPPRFCMVQRGGIVIMLSQLDEPRGSFPNHRVDPERGAWDAYVWVEDAEALHAEFVANGVTIARAPCVQPYHCLDFEIDDLDGYRLCFGADLGGGTGS
jgi:catechol 2,3-dioxygenase-like lactoylglutathione lyase family enzyme